ncbi:hypothetical protein EV426DRAFT_616528 [Tirmania nivea]|nr:hypothetical protein EV426DRAFT_616528 [Tirmania nivea]
MCVEANRYWHIYSIHIYKNSAKCEGSKSECLFKITFHLRHAYIASVQRLTVTAFSPVSHVPATYLYSEVIAFRVIDTIGFLNMRSMLRSRSATTIGGDTSRSRSRNLIAQRALCSCPSREYKVGENWYTMIFGKSHLGAGLLLLNAFSSALKLSFKIPFSTKNHGDISVAQLNRDTGILDIIYVPAGENTKRTYGYPPRLQPRSPLLGISIGSSDKTNHGTNSDLLDLLRKEKQEKFCEFYIDPSQVVTETVTETKCGKKDSGCVPVTKTEVKSVTAFVTSVVTADADAVTVDVVKTSVKTIKPTITVTSTVGTPLKPTSINDKRGAPAPPPFLADYPPAEISSACSTLIADNIQPTTVTQTEVITTACCDEPTTTIYITKTVATEEVIHTDIPKQLTHMNIISTTTITTTGTDTATSTTTVCPSETPYTQAIGQGGGIMETPHLGSAVKCCSACYYGNKSCWAWAWLGAENCVVIVGAGSDPKTDQCPKGKGDFFVIVDAEEETLEEHVSGAGPCWSGQAW